MRLYFIVIVICSFAALNSSGESAGPTSQEMIRKRPSQAKVIEVWRSVAQQASVPEEAVRLGSELIGETLRIADVDPSGPQIDAFKSSLMRFIRSYELNRVPADHRDQFVRWLAFCTGEAFSRPTPAQGETTMIVDGYARLASDVAPVVSDNLGGHLPADQRVVQAQKIKQATEQFETTVKKRISELNADFLYPGFKTPLNDELRSRILERFKAAPPLKVREPIEKTRNRDEEYRRRIESQMEYLCTRFQENCTLEAVKYRIVFNPYWGNTFYIGGTLYGEWPILIGLKVNEDRNKRDGWHPGVIPLNLYPPYGEKSEISWNWERMKKLAATTQAAGATTSTVK